MPVSHSGGSDQWILSLAIYLRVKKHPEMTSAVYQVCFFFFFFLKFFGSDPSNLQQRDELKQFILVLH